MNQVLVHEGDEATGPIFVLMALDSGCSQLVVARASEVTEEAWNKAIRFCWAAGWVPRDDDPDVYFKALDMEIYRLEEADDYAHEDEEVA